MEVNFFPSISFGIISPFCGNINTWACPILQELKMPPREAFGAIRETDVDGAM